ncbi:hypothetical protein PV325_005915 [Microctonus aethiopoides]|nr:hypothetical protein PV325_005915 [Microctonus aethiopoides]
MPIVNDTEEEPPDGSTAEWRTWDANNSRAQYEMPENSKIAEHISSIELLVKQLKNVQKTISDSAI